MSLHKSLVTGGKLDRARSVLTREERLQRLAEEGRYVAGESAVYGLPKVRTVFKAKGKGKKKKEEEEKEKAK